jgi:hypothetical protein
MQSFLPYPDDARSAAVLDSRRLGKQRVECLQILSVLTGLRAPWPPGATSGPVETYVPKGWVNHPAVRMWRGHADALVAYTLEVCAEWERRGHRDTVAPKVRAIATTAGLSIPHGSVSDAVTRPEWWGSEALHQSHRSNLLRKDEEYYREYFPETPPDLPYHWPV